MLMVIHSPGLQIECGEKLEDQIKDQLVSVQIQTEIFHTDGTLEDHQVHLAQKYFMGQLQVVK